MIKAYCDGCGLEIDRNYVSEILCLTIQLGGQEITAEVSVFIDGNKDKGELCLSCLKKVLLEGKEE